MTAVEVERRPLSIGQAEIPPDKPASIRSNRAVWEMAREVVKAIKKLLNRVIVKGLVQLAIGKGGTVLLEIEDRVPGRRGIDRLPFLLLLSSLKPPLTTTRAIATVRSYNTFSLKPLADSCCRLDV